MFRSRYVCGPVGHEESGQSIPLLPELEASFSALVGGCELGMEGLRRAMLATDALDDSQVGDLHSALRHDPSLHYETESLQLSDTADLCRLSQLRLQSTSDPILHDRHLGDDPTDVMYTELTSPYRDFSPGSTGDGDCGLEPELSDSSSSESGLESPVPAVQWDTIAECAGVSISMDPEGPLPPVSDIFAHKLPKEDFGDIYSHRSLPFHIKSERADSEEDDSMDSSLPSLSSSSSSLSKQQSPLLSYTTLQTHHHHQFLPATVPPVSVPPFTPSTTTNNSNYHDYTSTPREEAGSEAGGDWVEESSPRSGLRHESSGSEGEKGQRKKPGRKKGQVSKVLHLWEFIRDLLSDPAYCPSIISWENETEGVFRVLQSSEVARLWGEKKKNKKIMTYEKLSRSLRYSRKEGYFDALPRDRGYPKKLCFKFGPKSHGWREYKD